ncbi:MAG: hypothetical protein GX680_04560, partial [Bacteroidales bacterium]|nr:hypothetical protein [Bacteroidales bacterium]
MNAPNERPFLILSAYQPRRAPPQYSHLPLASAIVVAPQNGQVTACLGALAA